MLSIIISSYQPAYYEALVKNIQDTIGDGFIYEIIQIWNPNLMSITKAYNSGAEKSQYENLLFLHEDLIFHTENWGSKLIKHLQNSKTGIVGIAGSSYVPFAPSSWTVDEKYNSVNILQGNKKGTSFEHIKKNIKPQTPVFAVDGVFMAISKAHFSLIKFDESLGGFHGYDLDFSLRSSQIFQNVLADDILICHFSSGNLGKEWLDANIKIKQRKIGKFQYKNDSSTEKTVFLGFLYRYFSFYPVNIKNILFTVRFFPFKRLNFTDRIEILKKYLNYIIHKNNLNKKRK